MPTFDENLGCIHHGARRRGGAQEIMFSHEDLIWTYKGDVKKGKANKQLRIGSCFTNITIPLEDFDPVMQSSQFEATDLNFVRNWTIFVFVTVHKFHREVPSSLVIRVLVLCEEILSICHFMWNNTFACYDFMVGDSYYLSFHVPFRGRWTFRILKLTCTIQPKGFRRHWKALREGRIFKNCSFVIRPHFNNFWTFFWQRRCLISFGNPLALALG
jgi:hypothetical protein